MEGHTVLVEILGPDHPTVLGSRQWLFVLALKLGLSYWLKIVHKSSHPTVGVLKIGVQ